MTPPHPGHSVLGKRAGRLVSYFQSEVSGSPRRFRYMGNQWRGMSENPEMNHEILMTYAEIR